MVTLGWVSPFLQFLVVFAGLAAILTFLGWVAVRARRNNSGSQVIDVFDQIWHPIAHDQYVEVAQHEERGASKALPGDRPDWLLDTDKGAPAGADAPLEKN